MKKYTILIIITLITLGISTYILTRNKEDNLYTAYKDMYEASTLLSNITYDINITWDYYLTDENFNRTDLVKKISLSNEDMINDTCNLIYTKKIDVILDCIVLSHKKNYDLAKKQINDSKEILKKEKSNSNYNDLKLYNDYLNEYLEISKYFGDDYDKYKEKLEKLKNKINKIEDKYRDIYVVVSNNSL